MKKRPFLVISSTVMGTVGVLSYVPTSTSAMAPATNNAVAQFANTQTKATAAPTSGSATKSKASGKSASAARTVKQTKTPTKGPASLTNTATKAPASAPAAPASAPAAAPSATRTITGSTIQTQFGPVQVQITVQGTKIISAKALQTPQGGRSSQINQQAVPYLVQQTLAAQSASIQGVSGATFTTGAWVGSLQSALAKA